METIKSKLSSIGAGMVLYGIASIVLSFFNYNLKLLSWIDIWGESMGWIIRIALIVGGGALYLLFNKDEIDEEEA